MGKVDIVTAQNVKISYQLANIGERVLAFIIDIVIIYGVVFFSLAAFMVSFDGNPPEHLMWILIMFLLPLFFYHLVLEIIFNGQSFGKKLMKIKVVRLDGSSAGIDQYILRWIMRFIDFGIFSGLVAFISIMLSEKSQRLGDMVAGTTVIKLIDTENFLQRHNSNIVADDYQPVFSAAAQLSAEHIRLIEKAIEIRRDTLNEKPLKLIIQKTKDLSGISSDMPDLKFAYTIIKDYNFYTSREAV